MCGLVDFGSLDFNGFSLQGFTSIQVNFTDVVAFRICFKKYNVMSL